MPLERLLMAETVDRAAHRRVEPGLLEALSRSADTRYLLVSGRRGFGTAGEAAREVPAAAAGEATVVAGQSPRLLRLRHEEVPARLRTCIEAVFAGEDGGPVVCLPVPEEEADAVAAELDRPDATWLDLRATASLLAAADACLLTTGVAVGAWHQDNRWCPRCGGSTTVRAAGWLRACTRCGREAYPRTDPAVIMAVVDADDRVLLGRHPDWPPHRYSTLAGFVEPGEDVEAAVRREVMEEAGVRVGDVHYRGSQPWPYPRSLMLGFRARALTTRVRVDGEELEDARWWSRQDAARDLARGTLLLPPRVSLSRLLIEEWFGARVEERAEWR